MRPWILATLGLAALGVLVWFAGPLLVIGGQAPLASPQSRLLVMAVFTLQYVVQKLWYRFRARRTNDRVVSELTPAPASGLPQEAEQLRKRFADALAELRRVRFGTRGGYWSSLSWKFGRSYLYQLPWYVIIGAPGAGKTTALLKSGLSFPLAEKLGRGAVRGVGGTRNCDWWFTDRAVLIDTAGRYTTHESDRVADRQAWEVFLKLLRRARPQHPLNGVLVAVSLGDLLQFTPEQVAEHGRVLRARLEELQIALGVRLPVYVLLTKCDLLPGFVDWFGAFDRRERDQVWGITFDLRDTDSAAAAAEFAGSFEQLVDRLADGLVERLQAERDSQRRGRIFALPRQLRALGQPLDSLIRGAFTPSRRAAAAAPCLRGVYLTSGTQQGTPIDRMLSAFGRELGLERQILPPNQSTGKSFFLSRLLSNVVFAEADLSCHSPLRQRWERRARLASIVAIQLAAIGVAAWWVSSYLRSAQDIARFDAQIDSVRAVVDAMPTRTGSDPRALLPSLDATRAMADTRLRAASSSKPMDMGARSRRKLAAAAYAAYERMLLGPFQARIGKALDATLRSGADPNLQYEALKTYAMLRDPSHFDATGIKVFVMSYWDAVLTPPLGPTERAQLAEHLDALLKAGAVGSGMTVEPALVESVRNRLSAQSPAQRIALRLRVLSDTYPYPDFTVASLGPAAAALFVGADGTSAPRAVPRLYTIEASRRALATDAPTMASQLTSESPWVLGSVKAGSGAVIAEFTASYRAAYAQAWADFIGDLHLKTAGSNQEAIQQAQLLGTAGGPLVLLLHAIVHQTDGPIAPADPQAARFTELTAFVARRRDSSPLEEALESFSEVAALRAPPHAESATGATPSPQLAHITAQAAHDPEPVRSMLLALAVVPASAPLQPARASPAELSRLVAARLGPTCIRLVAGHFPFVRSALRDVSLEDFSRLFAPGKGFDEVFEQLLGARVDTSSDTWQVRRPGSGPPMEDLERFRSAARIREVFFRRGGTQPAIELTFRPLDLDQNIDRFQLEVDGQTVRYAHGPPEATSVKWPGPQGGSARIDVTPASQGDPIEYSGHWALFRLMDHAAVQESGTPGHFRVVFDVGGHHASFEVESNSGADPFRLPELEHFDCPLAGS